MITYSNIFITNTNLQTHTAEDTDEFVQDQGVENANKQGDNSNGIQLNPSLSTQIMCDR